MKKKLLLCLFLAITGIIHAADTQTIEYTDSSGKVISRYKIGKNLIDQSNVLKGLSADPSGNSAYQVKDPKITDLHVSRLIRFLEFAADNDFSNQENIIQAMENFQATFRKFREYPLMYTEDIRIAREFDIQGLELVLSRLEEKLAKRDYFATGNTANPYFRGVSIQDLIDHNRIPSAFYGGVNLGGKHISSLDGIENIPGVQNLQVLDLRHNRITSIPSNIQGLKNLTRIFHEG